MDDRATAVDDRRRGDGGVEDRGSREGRQWKGEVRKKREHGTPFILSSLWHRVKTPPDAKKVLRHWLEDHPVPMESHRHRVEISPGAKKPQRAGNEKGLRHQLESENRCLRLFSVVL